MRTAAARKSFSRKCSHRGEFVSVHYCKPGAEVPVPARMATSRGKYDNCPFRDLPPGLERYVRCVLAAGESTWANELLLADPAAPIRRRCDAARTRLQRPGIARLRGGLYAALRWLIALHSSTLWNEVRLSVLPAPKCVNSRTSDKNVPALDS